MVVKKGKGQITLFIIIGLLALASIAMLFYLFNLMKPAPAISAEKDDITIYVEQCLHNVADEGLGLIGMQGGFIDASQVREDAVLNMGGLRLPYWYYQTGSGIDSSEMPPLEKSYPNDGSIEDQLERYIQDALPVCLDSFKPFREKGILVYPKKLPEIKLAFTENKVVVIGHYTLEVKRGDDIELKSDFITELPVRLRTVYRLAEEIKRHEENTVFLERHTRNMISAYSRIDKDYLPPMEGGLDFAPCEKRVFWNYRDVEENLRRMLSSNVPFLRIANTDFERIEVTDEPNPKNRRIRQGILDTMVQQVSDNLYRGVSVLFYYDTLFPTDFDIGGKGVLEPNSFELNLLFSRLCMMQYSFSYSLKYPVLVTLIDRNSRQANSDYIFQFPLQAVLKDNFPRVRYSEAMGIPLETRTSFQCDMAQRLSGEVKISVSDDAGQPIDRAGIFFQCGPQFVYTFDEKGGLTDIERFAERCFIGSTDQGVIVTRLPPCGGGGMLTIQKEGYVAKQDIIGTVEEGLGFEKSYVLEKITEKKLTIMKYALKPPAVDGEIEPNPGVVLQDGEIVACNPARNALPLLATEDVIVRLSKIDGDQEVTRFYNVNNLTLIPLAPGRYKAELQLMRRERFEGEMTIKANSQKKVVNTGISTKEYYYPEKDVLMPVALTGGSVFEFTVSADDSRYGREVIFYVFDEGIPQYIENMGRPMMDREKCSELNVDLLRPRFT